jgi:hypothetical protein
VDPLIGWLQTVAGWVVAVLLTIVIGQALSRIADAVFQVAGALDSNTAAQQETTAAIIRLQEELRDLRDQWRPPLDSDPRDGTSSGNPIV